jgi:DNA modification methylase
MNTVKDIKLNKDEGLRVKMEDLNLNLKTLNLKLLPYIDTTMHGDARELLKTLPSESVDCCITSPPYWGLRDYGVEGQLGLERTPEEYVAKLVEVFREVKRVLKKEGTLWLNLGDSYAGSGKGGQSEEKRSENWQPKYPHIGETARVAAKTKFAGEERTPSGLKPKDLVGIPWMVAFALRADGWWLRQDIIWHKPNPMPESVTDRCTKSHEYIFLLSK